MTASVQLARNVAALSAQGMFLPILAHLPGDFIRRVGMARVLDEQAINLRDTPFGMLADQPSRRLQYPKVLVRVALRTESVGIATVCQQRFKIVVRGSQYDARWSCVTPMTVVPFVPV